MSTLMTPTDYVALPIIAGDEQLRYGEGADQFGDLYLPPSDTTNPVPLLLLHGGCWQHAFGLAPMGQFARALTDLGFLVCNLEYRRLGGGGGWPNTFIDVTAGLIEFAKCALSYGADPANVVVSGHSAGGHLALWLASRWRLPTDSELYNELAPQPKAVVSLAGIGDLGHALVRGICRGSPGDLVGGGLDEQPERHAHASPHALLPSNVRQWHVVGRDDVLVPADSVEAFVAQSRESGDHATLDLVAPSGHFEIVATNSPRWPDVRGVFTDALAFARS
jgi:acetyl esterase/lipase